MSERTEIAKYLRERGRYAEADAVERGEHKAPKAPAIDFSRESLERDGHTCQNGGHCRLCMW